MEASSLLSPFAYCMHFTNFIVIMNVLINNMLTANVTQMQRDESRKLIRLD